MKPPSINRREFMVALAAASLSSTAQAAEVTRLPSNHTAILLLRALAYDRRVGRRGDPMKILVLRRPEYRSSLREAKAMAKAWKKLEKYTVRGLPFRVEVAAWQNPSALRELLAAKPVGALFLTEALFPLSEQIVRETRAAKVTSMSSGWRAVAKGVTLGVGQENHRPQIFINESASQAEGARFGSQLLSLAKVLDPVG